MTSTAELGVAQYAARISLWALGVAGGSLIVTASLFALEIRRWFNEGVRLFMSVMVDARLIGTPIKDNNTYLSITVSNRGSSPTTITHMVIYKYPNKFSRCIPNHPTWFFTIFKKQRPLTMIVPDPIIQALPYVLEPGRNWQGMACQTPEINSMIDSERLYVGIVDSYSNRPFLKRVRRWHQ